MEIKLQEPIRDFAGNGILQPNQVPLTIQDVILMHLGLCKADTGKEAIAVSVLGHKIYECQEDSIDLTLEECKIISRSIQEPKMTALVMAPLFTLMEDLLNS